MLICLFCNVCGRISPSDAESTASEQSSGRETGEESTRPSTVANEEKPRRAVKKGLLLYFFLLVCSSALLWLSYSVAVTFLNSPLVVDFSASSHRKYLHTWFSFFCSSEEPYISFIPASF